MNSPKNTPENCQGFALVIALSLMAFVLLLLLSITTLVQVETRSARISVTQTEAEQNALLGLQEALGALQVSMGPDQRISATADVLVATVPSRKQLTGVWVSDPAGASLNGTTYAEGELLRWLVSDFQGVNDNESAAPTVDAVTLVGAGSLADANQDGVADDSDEVVTVALTEIGGSESTGNYAWWVGDEGVKACINLSDASEDSALGPNEKKQAALQTLSSSARADVGALTGLSAVDLQSGELADKLLGLDDMALATSAPSTDQVKAYFHDLTTYSKGVLSDARNGGLKQDLSLAFELPDAAFNMSVFGSGGPDTIMSPGFGQVQPIFRLANSSGTPANGPTWHLLRDYYTLYQRMENPMTDPTLSVQALVPNRSELNPDNDSQSVPELATGRYLVDPVLGRGVAGDPLRCWEGDVTPGALVIPVKANYLPYVQRHVVSVGLTSKAAEAPAGYVGPYTFVKLNEHMRASFVVHNPYNVSLRHTGMISAIDYFQCDIKVESELDDSFDIDAVGAWNQHLLKVESGTISPGAIKVYAASQAGAGSDFSVPGVSRDFWEVPPNKNNTEFQDSSFPVGNGVDIKIYYGSSKWFYNPRHSISVPGVDVPVASNNQNWDVTQNQKFSNYGALNTRMVTKYEDWYGGADEGQVFDAEVYPTNGTVVMPLVTFDYYLKPAEHSGFPYPGLSHTNPLAPIIDSRNLFPNRLDKPGIDFGCSPYAPNWQVKISRNMNTTADELESEGINDAFWGASHSSDGRTQVSAIALPTSPLTSLGGLQSANVGIYGHMPALAIGNSLASPYIARDQSYAFFQSDSGQQPRIFYDLSYLCNEALWDRYFFSSYARAYDADADAYSGSLGDSFDRAFDPATNSSSALRSLANSRMEQHQTDETLGAIKAKLFDGSGDPLNTAYERAAENLMVKGSFNVHSTSVDAWKAMLASARNMAIYQAGESAETSYTDNYTPITRAQQPNAGAFDSKTGSYLDAAGWGGFATLSDDQLQALAVAIVAEIKLRVSNQGTVFTSMAAFVNRSLANDDFGLAGLLQAAIDQSGINTAFSDANIEVVATDLESSIGNFPVPDNILDGAKQARSAATSATGHIMQGDLLQVIGSFAAVRSDTFRIRSYGEVLDPVTQVPTGRAWCEAIVQRIPDPVQPSDPDPQNAAYWQPENEDFLGRKFKIINFRWLDENEV